MNLLKEDVREIDQQVKKGLLSPHRGRQLKEKLKELKKENRRGYHSTRYNSKSIMSVCLTEAPMSDFINGNDEATLNRWLKENGYGRIESRHWYVKNLSGLSGFLHCKAALRTLNQLDVAMQKQRRDVNLRGLSDSHWALNVYAPIPKSQEYLVVYRDRKNAHDILKRVWDIILNTFEKRLPPTLGGPLLTEYVKKEGLSWEIVGYRAEDGGSTLLPRPPSSEFEMLSRGLTGVTHLRTPYEEICFMLEDDLLTQEVRMEAERTKEEIIDIIHKTREVHIRQQKKDQAIREYAYINNIRLSIGLPVDEYSLHRQEKWIPTGSESKDKTENRGRSNGGNHLTHAHRGKDSETYLSKESRTPKMKGSIARMKSSIKKPFEELRRSKLIDEMAKKDKEILWTLFLPTSFSVDEEELLLKELDIFRQRVAEKRCLVGKSFGCRYSSETRKSLLESTVGDFLFPEEKKFLRRVTREYGWADIDMESEISGWQHLRHVLSRMREIRESQPSLHYPHVFNKDKYRSLYERIQMMCMYPTESCFEYEIQDGNVEQSSDKKDFKMFAELTEGVSNVEHLYVPYEEIIKMLMHSEEHDPDVVEKAKKTLEDIEQLIVEKRHQDKADKAWRDTVHIQQIRQAVVGIPHHAKTEGEPNRAKPENGTSNGKTTD